MVNHFTPKSDWSCNNAFACSSLWFIHFVKHFMQLFYILSLILPVSKVFGNLSYGGFCCLSLLGVCFFVSELLAHRWILISYSWGDINLVYLPLESVITHVNLCGNLKFISLPPRHIFRAWHFSLGTAQLWCSYLLSAPGWSFNFLIWRNGLPWGFPFVSVSPE